MGAHIPGYDVPTLLGRGGMGLDMCTLVGHAGAINCVAVSADGRYLASAAADDTVRVWDAPQPK